MQRLRQQQHPFYAILLAVVLLASQSLMLWHSHDDGAAEQAGCELCVHVQLHSPLPASPLPQVFVALALVDIRQSVVIVVSAKDYSFTYTSRAPPRFLLS